jgi:hypothetical protein
MLWLAQKSFSQLDSVWGEMHLLFANFANEVGLDKEFADRIDCLGVEADLGADLIPVEGHFDIASLFGQPIQP